MRDDLFSVPIRKYHVDNNDEFLKLTEDVYQKSKFDVPSPFIYGIAAVPPEISSTYNDLLENFLQDIGCYDTHNAVVNSMIVKILEPGESIDRCDTLPSHYTLTHYVQVPDGDASDTFHHPARSVVTAFAPAYIDEWRNAAGIYVNQGDVIIHPSFLETSSPVNEVPSSKRITLTLTILLNPNEQGRESNTKKPVA
tara:strand:+ start:778 stop:1365 length:588 start_codon:yes stop_codon:yes gene_type:complete